MLTQRQMCTRQAKVGIWAVSSPQQFQVPAVPGADGKADGFAPLGGLDGSVGSRRADLEPDQGMVVARRRPLQPHRGARAEIKQGSSVSIVDEVDDLAKWFQGGAASTGPVGSFDEVALSNREEPDIVRCVFERQAVDRAKQDPAWVLGVSLGQ